MRARWMLWPAEGGPGGGTGPADAGADARSVVVTADAGATVGDVADALAVAGPTLPAGTAWTLAARAPGGGAWRPLRRSAEVAEAGARPGADVRLVPAAPEPRGAHRRPADGPAVAAVLEVLAGPDAGLVAEVTAGASTVGRAAGCDVRLTDPRVAPLHARLLVGVGVGVGGGAGAGIELVDAGTAAGLTVAGGRADRVALGPSDVVLLGDSVVQVRPVPGAAAPEPVLSRFVRSPHVVPRFVERSVEAPAPPEPPTPARFPVLATLAPLVLGAVLVVTHGLVGLLLVALSPVLAVGAWWDRRVQDRRRARTAGAAFEESLAAAVAAVRALQQEEAAGRRVEQPGLAEVLAAAHARTGPLWSRRPEHPAALTVRVGSGPAASRVRLAVAGGARAVPDDVPDAVPAADAAPTAATGRPQHAAALAAAQASVADVADVPHVADLRTCGAVGVAQARGRGVARGLVAQLVGLHAPGELVVAAATATAGAPDWGWLRWLPHVADAGSPLPGPHLGAGSAAAGSLVGRLEELVASRAAVGAGGARPWPAVLVVVEDDVPVERGRLVALAEQGPTVGVHLLWCAATVAALPAACRTFVEVVEGTAQAAPSAPGTLAVRAGWTTTGTWAHLGAEVLDPATAEAFGRALCPVVDAGALTADARDVPAAVDLLALTGPELAHDPGAAVARWRETGSLLDRTGPPRALPPGAPDATLRAVVGQGADGPLVLDLRSQGPHALVGGTTGAGKSELLQAWVLGLAAAHSPDRVTFLLVDYKGGAAFADCVGLPHTVGLVTDLSGHLVRRALTSLRAELRHRERLLQRKGVKDLLALERTGDPETPPALVIVVDEFATLVREVPAFVDGVLDVAQRGRSLGLHLVLATQRPAGVVTDALRANTALRIALRVADEHDSADVVGVPLAAHLDPGTPGRAVVRTGPGRVATFQTAWAGGRGGGRRRRPAVRVEDLGLGPGAAWPAVAGPAEGASGTRPASDDDGPTDAARLTATLRAAAAAAGVPAPRRPWLPDLPPVLPLDLTAGHGSGALPLGVLDVPAEQLQTAVVYRPDEHGCLAVFGAGGSGRTTVLRTVALGAATAADPVQVHALDLGAGGLAVLEALPAVGSVVEAGDHERTARLLLGLRGVVEERAGRFAAVHAGGLADYRERAGRPDEPRVLLLVDGVGALRDALETDPARAAAWAAFCRVVTDGRAVGVHVVLTAERPGALPASLAGAVAARVVLRQPDEAAHLQLGVPRDVLGPGAPPGRAVLAGAGDELQVAVAGGSADVADQAAEIVRVAAVLTAAGAVATPPVGRLPLRVVAQNLPALVDDRPVLGLADDTLAPVGLEATGTLLVAGPPGSGRSSALRTVAAAVRRAHPGARLVHLAAEPPADRTVDPAVDPAGAAAAPWTEVVTGPAEVAARAAELLRHVAGPVGAGPVGAGPAGAGPAGAAPVGAPLVVVVAGLPDFLGTPAEAPLTELVRAARRRRLLLVAEAETGAWSSAWPLVAEVRAGRRGIVLQPGPTDGELLLRTPLPRAVPGPPVPGRGVLVEAGGARRLQLAVA